MCYYNPNYNCVEIKPKDISFNPDDFKKKVNHIKRIKNLKKF